MARISNLDRTMHEFNSLRPVWGGKAAWTMVLENRNLAQKLGFEIPSYVPLKKEVAVNIREAFNKIKKATKNFFPDGNNEYTKRLDFSLSFLCESTLPILFGSSISDGKFEAQVLNLMDTTWKPFLSFATKDEWTDFFRSIKEATYMKRYVNNNALPENSLYPEVSFGPGSNMKFPERIVSKSAINGFRDSVWSKIFLQLLNSENRSQWNKMTEALSLDQICRSSGFGEDSFETAMAGFAKSPVTDRFSNIRAIYEAMEVNEYGKYLDQTVFLQSLVFAPEKSGIIFSDLFGKTCIEAVIGDGETAVLGMNNTIIDILKNGCIENIIYGFHGKPLWISWKSIGMTDKDDKSQMEYLWNNMTARINFKGREYISPLDIHEVDALRNIAVEIEKELGFKVDIEFAIKDGKIYILQVRPITGDNEKPVPLPHFNASDIIATIPVSIGKTPIGTKPGYIVKIKDIDDICENDEESTKLRESVLKSLSISFDEFIPAIDNQTWRRPFPLVIDHKKASRIYHTAINLREAGIVIAGMPGLFESPDAFPNLHWRTVDTEAGPAQISVEKVKFYSDGFRGVMVKADAEPIGE